MINYIVITSFLALIEMDMEFVQCFEIFSYLFKKLYQLVR